jgi:hypothetical protein
MECYWNPELIPSQPPTTDKNKNNKDIDVNAFKGKKVPFINSSTSNENDDEVLFLGEDDHC